MTRFVYKLPLSKHIIKDGRVQLKVEIEDVHVITKYCTLYKPLEVSE